MADDFTRQRQRRNHSSGELELMMKGHVGYRLALAGAFLAVALAFFAAQNTSSGTASADLSASPLSGERTTTTETWQPTPGIKIVQPEKAPEGKEPNAPFSLVGEDHRAKAEEIVRQNPELGAYLDSGVATVVDDSYWGDGGAVSGVALYLAFKEPVTLKQALPAYVHTGELGEAAHESGQALDTKTDQHGLPLTEPSEPSALSDITYLQVLVADTTSSIHSVQKLN